MRSARTAKHIIIGLLLLGILLVGGWYFLYPYSLGSRISASEPLSLSVNITGVTVTGKDTVDTVTYEFQPDTQEYKALVSLLNDYDYHRSFLTLLPLEDYTPDSNTTTFQLQSTDSQYLLTDKGGGAGFRRKIPRLRNRVSGQRQGGTAYRRIAGTAEKLYAGGNA